MRELRGLHFCVPHRHANSCRLGNSRTCKSRLWKKSSQGLMLLLADVSRGASAAHRHRSQQKCDSLFCCHANFWNNSNYCRLPHVAIKVVSRCFLHLPHSSLRRRRRVNGKNCSMLVFMCIKRIRVERAKLVSYNGAKSPRIKFALVRCAFCWIVTYSQNICRRWKERRACSESFVHSWKFNIYFVSIARRRAWFVVLN